MNTERLDAIQARLGAAEPGPWFLDTDGVSIYYVFHNGDTLDRDRLAESSGADAEFIAAAPSDVAYLLDLARKQQAALNDVSALAYSWEVRGEHDMRFSKTIPDEDIAAAILTNGAQMVENARHIRNALEAKP